MKQISVIAKDREDITAAIAELMAEKSINIETLDIERVEGTSVVTLTVDAYDDALSALQDAGFEAVTEDALLIRVPDAPGTLAKIARRFLDEDIHVRSLRILRRRNGWGIVAVSVDRTDRAYELLGEYIISEDRLRFGPQKTEVDHEGDSD